MWSWDGQGAWMGWWMLVSMTFWLVVLAVLVWAIVKVVGGSRGLVDESPEQILKRRYARGEVDREEYERRLSDLRR